MPEKVPEKQSKRVLVSRGALSFFPVRFFFFRRRKKKTLLVRLQNFFSSLAPHCLLRKLFYVHPPSPPSLPRPFHQTSTMREVISLHIGQAGTWNVAKENARERESREREKTEKRKMQVKDDARSKRLFVSSPSFSLHSRRVSCLSSTSSASFLVSRPGA